MKKIFLIITGTALLFSARGQTLSGYFVGSGALSSPTIDWAVGETVTQSYEQGAYLLTQGFIQPHYQTSSVDPVVSSNAFFLHPNPVSNSTVLLAPGEFESGDPYSIEVYSVTGQLLSRKPLEKNRKQLDFSNYPDGLYFITIRRNFQAIQTIKCIKL